MTPFELCRELNLKGFPQVRKDDSWYYVTPEILVMMRDFDDLKLQDRRTTVDFDKLIYKPELDDFIEFLGTDLQQVIQTNASGWFAYSNSTVMQGATTRSGGATIWLALANVTLARYLERDMKFPIVDVSESENVQTSQELPVAEQDNENNA